MSVAEELHFGRGAARAFVSQPALSQAIARLERALGVQLLVRNRRSVRLTEAGEELLLQARRLLAACDDAVGRVRRIGLGESGLLRAGVALLAEEAVAPALTALADEHPEVALDRVSAISERLLDQLRDGGLDLAMVHQVQALLAPDDLDWEVLRRGRLAVLVREGHPLAAREESRLEELRDETFLVNPRRLAPSAYQGLHQMCRPIGGFAPKVLESATLAIDPDWRPILAGAAIGLVPEGEARRRRPAEIAAAPIEPPPRFVIALVWRRGDRSPLLDLAIGFIRRYRDERGWVTASPW